MVSHVLVIGETQSGKTFYANKLHQGSDQTVSIFFNTNHVPNLWGVKVNSLAGLMQAIRSREKGGQEADKVVFFPHRGSGKDDMERTRAQLKEIIDLLFKLWTHESKLWARILIDEAQWFEDEARYATTMALGKHIQVVLITQYPVMVDTTSRSNMPAWVIFKTGFQMEKFFQGYGDLFPRDEILRITAQKYHFVRHSPDAGWEWFPPVP